MSAVNEISTQPERRAQRRAHRQAQSHQNRFDILDAAVWIFSQREIRTGSLREIEDEVGSSAATITFFFENKPHVLSETLTGRGDELLPIIRAPADAELVPLEKDHLLVDETVSSFTERPYFRLPIRHVRGDTTVTGPPRLRSPIR